MGDKEFSFRHIAFEVLAGLPREMPTKEVRNRIRHLEKQGQGHRTLSWRSGDRSG